MRLSVPVLFVGCTWCQEVQDSLPHTGVDSPIESEVDSTCDTNETWYEDHDGDGQGDAARRTSCDDPAGASTDPHDCDDTHAQVYNGAPELATSGRDDDCDGKGSTVVVTSVASWSVSAYEEGLPVGFGGGVALAGDLTGDAVSDVVISSNRYFDARGRVFLYPGPFEPSAEAVPEEDAFAVLLGHDERDFGGVLGAGDVDGDGSPDLLASGRTTANEQATWLLRGPIPTGEWELDSLTDPWLIDTTVSIPMMIAPGDLNGDGLDDVVFCDYETKDKDRAGKAFVMLGPATQATPYEADTTLLGAPGQAIGDSIASLGDLDGDGLTDFGLTAGVNIREDPYAGQRTYLVLDLPSGTVHPEETGVTIWGDQHDTTGWSSQVVQEVGDINGDGHSDVGFTQGFYYGYVMFGPFGGEPELDMATQWQAAFVAASVGGDGHIGMLEPLGDWDGDGHSDLAVPDDGYVPQESRHDESCWFYGINLCKTGVVYLVAGPVEGGTYSLDEQADHLIGPDSGFAMPSAIASGDDLDGDGHWDLLVGHEQRDTAFLLLGGGCY